MEEETRVHRILICHEDPATLRVLSDTANLALTDEVTVYTCTALTEVLGMANQLQPSVVMLDVGRSTELAVEITRTLRGTGRSVIGLYNPLTLNVDESRVLRQAVRAGVIDFVPLPPSPVELRGAFLSAVKGMSAPAKEARSVAFFSPKGGVGTSMLALNVALAVARQTEEGDVALCDTNLQSSELADMLGFSAESNFSEFLSDLDREGPVESYVVQEPTTGLYVLAGSSDPVAAATADPQDLSRILVALRRRFNSLILDTASSLDVFSLSVMDLCETVCVVVTPSVPALRVTSRMLDLLDAQGLAGRIRVVLNQVTGDGNLSRKVAEDELGRAVSCLIPYEKRGMEAVNRGEPISLDRGKSECKGAIEELAHLLFPRGDADSDRATI